MPTSFTTSQRRPFSVPNAAKRQASRLALEALRVGARNPNHTVRDIRTVRKSPCVVYDMRRRTTRSDIAPFDLCHGDVLSKNELFGCDESFKGMLFGVKRASNMKTRAAADDLFGPDVVDEEEEAMEEEPSVEFGQQWTAFMSRLRNEYSKAGDALKALDELRAQNELLRREVEQLELAETSYQETELEEEAGGDCDNNDRYEPGSLRDAEVA